MGTALQGFPDQKIWVLPRCTGDGKPVECLPCASPGPQVKPELHEAAPNTQKVGLDVQATLVPSAPWVTCSPTLPLTHGGAGFDLKVACSALPPGAHYADVAGYDAAKPGSLGPLFRVPVAVIRPHADLMAPGAGLTYGYDALPFAPGHIERRFVVPPTGATWATVTIEARAAPRSRELAGSCAYMLHTTQLLPSTSIQELEYVTRLTLLGGSTPAAARHSTHSMDVVGGVLMEVTVAQWWSSLGDTDVSLSIEFHGLTPDRALTLDGRALFGELQVRRLPSAAAASCGVQRCRYGARERMHRTCLPPDRCVVHTTIP